MITPPARHSAGGGWPEAARDGPGAIHPEKGGHTREILRQKLTLSHRAIAQSLGLSSGTVGAAVLRARAAGLDWPQVEALTNDALEGRLYGLRAVAGSRGRPWPDCAVLHAERPKPVVTLELLHLEYLEQHPTGIGTLSSARSTASGSAGAVFPCGRFTTPARSSSSTTPARSRASSTRPPGSGSPTYAEATLTQRVPDWIASHQRAFAFFGGVPAAIVCDQLKSSVVVPCRHEPGLQRTYEELAQHCGTVIVPARPAKSRDNARPTLGKIMLRSLLRGHCKALLAKKRAEGVSKNSVRIIRATLSVMLGDAVDDGIHGEPCARHQP